MRSLSETSSFGSFGHPGRDHLLRQALNDSELNGGDGDGGSIELKGGKSYGKGLSNSGGNVVIHGGLSHQGTGGDIELTSRASLLGSSGCTNINIIV